MAVATKASSAEVISRILALVAGLTILFFLYSRWGDEMTALVRGNIAQDPPKTELIAAEDNNPALTNCLEKRLGDVNKMKDEGVINDAQFAKFSERASELCKAQNPKQ